MSAVVLRLLDPRRLAQIRASGVQGLNNILFLKNPWQYEGEESERNVFYTFAAPNPQAIPAVTTDEG